MNTERVEITDELQISELNQEVRINIPEMNPSMDFADRLEYVWNLNED